MTTILHSKAKPPRSVRPSPIVALLVLSEKQRLERARATIADTRRRLGLMRQLELELPEAPK